MERSGRHADITELLKAVRSGNADALDQLVVVVYDELHVMAHNQRQRWHGNLTLNTTAILNETYIKLADQTGLAPESREHFFAAAAKAMRHILCNYARDRRRLKRGGGAEHEPITEVLEALGTYVPDEFGDDLAALSDALERLDRINPRQGQVVECRFFAGMTVAATAAALGLSPATVKRDWVIARAWLYREIRTEGSGGEMT